MTKSGDRRNLDTETQAHCFMKVFFLSLLDVDMTCSAWTTSLGCDLGRIPTFSAKEDVNTNKDSGLAARPKIAKEL